MSRLSGVIFLLVLCIGVSDAPAQVGRKTHPDVFERPLRFRHLTMADGLSQDKITAIFQDSLGFMWFGTEDGLNRYDGRHVRTFKPVPFDTLSLSNPWVVAVTPAGRGKMWIATEGRGLNLYDPTKESFQQIRIASDGEVSHDLLSMISARDGSLWVGTRYDGLYHYDPATKRAVAYRHDPDDAGSLSDVRVTALLEDRQGRIWAGTAIGGLNRLDPATGLWTVYRHDARQAGSLPRDGINALLEDRNGRIWIGTSGGGLSRYHPETDDFVSYRHFADDRQSISHDHVNALFEDPVGKLWIGTGAGLDRMDTSAGQFTRYQHDPANPASMPPGSVHAMYLDRTGVFWIGTSSGASFFPWKAPSFQLITSRPGDPNSLDNPSVWGITEDRDGVLWIGTSTGLNRVDRSAGTVTRYPVDRTEPTALHGGGVHGIYEDRNGDFWVGLHNGPLHLFDRTSGRVVERFSEDPADPTSLHNGTPWSFLEDDDGKMWIASGGRGCMSRMDLSSRTFERLCHEPDNPRTPSYDIGHKLIRSRDGTFWFATWGGGLDRFDPETGLFTNFRHDPTVLNSPASDFLLALHEDAEGILWLGHFGAGLDRFDPETGTFTHYSEANSDLPNNIILGIEEDDEGNIWMSSYRGLSRFSLRTGEFRNFGVEDGIQDLEFNSTATLRSADGMLFFGGVKGVTAFYPDEIEVNLVPPPVVLTALRIRGRPVEIGAEGPLHEALPFVRSLTLRHRQNDIEISFAALHFADPHRNRYRYRLEGYDAEWRRPEQDHPATYTNLSPGGYTFRVQAANSDGVWNEAGAALQFRILSPPWRTWWAYAIYVVLTLGALFGIRRYELGRFVLKNRLEIERVESQKLRELDQSRRRFFANVSHEFRTPLTLTLGPLDDIRAGWHGPLTPSMTEQVDLARRNAARVLDLINEMLEVARLEAGIAPLNARRLDLGAYVRDLAAIFMPMAERRSIALHVNIPPVPGDVYANPEHLEKVLSNLISNALKFTPEGGAVRVTMHSEPNTVHVSVRDSGPGIPPAELPRVFERFYRVDESGIERHMGSGIGLSLAKELVELHGGTLTVESEEGFGSTFTINLRRGRAHLAPEHIVEEDTRPWTPRVAPPIAEDTAHPPAAEIPATPHAADDRTTVLVVEDSAEVRAYVRRHLEPEYRILEAADGAHGLAMVRDHLPDLVLSDVMMPGLDGYALCRAIKSDPETDFIPVVLLTARAASEDRLEGLGEQADDYLTKPFDVAELRARIRNLIGLRHLLRERFRQEGIAFVMGDESGDGVSVLRAGQEDLRSADAVFLERVRDAIESNIGDEDFSVDRLAAEVGVSRAHLHRRLKVLLGQSPSDAIRTMRLERAAQFLSARVGSVSEVAYAVGFKSVAHFSNSFHDLHGVRPSSYTASGPRE